MQSFSPSYSRFRGNRQLFARTSLRVLVLATILCSLAVTAGLLLSRPPAVSAVTTVPTKMNFQGRLSDSTGNIKPNGTYNMRFKLFTVATAGTNVWSEDRLVSATQGVTVTNGLFSVQLGSVTALPASLFTSGALYLEVELPTPASATTSSPVWTEGPMTPRNQMATSAYAYNSETLDGQDGAWYQDASNLNAGTIASARVTGSYTGITGTGALAAGSIATGFGTIVTNNTISGTQLISTVATGTAPLAVTSTTLVANLNADLLDGQSGAYYQSATNLNAGTIASARVTGSYTGITGVGTLAAGTWQGSAVAVQYGGTGATSFTSNGILYGNGTGAVAATAAGTTGQCLTATTSAAPTWGSCNAGGASLTANNTFTGTNLFKPTANSATALQIQNSSSASLLTANTTNMRLSIGGSEVTRSADYSISFVPTFSAKTDYTTGTQPYDVTSADFNADGKSDLAVANYLSNTISVFMNNGTGTFAAKVDYATGSRPSSITSADFSGDGKPDIAVTNTSGASFSVFINNGTGTFAAKVDYATDQTPISLVAGDYSGDGKPDIVVASSYISGIDYVSRYTNNGTGTFAARVDIDSGNSSPNEVVMGDIDNDGLQDVITSGSNSNGGTNISYYRNTNGSTFAAPVDYASMSIGNIATVDLNNDSYDDVVAGSGSSISIFMNNGAGALSGRTDISSWVSIQKIVTADINGDGDQDIIVVDNHGGNSSASSISVILNNGDGTYTNKTNFGVGVAPLSATIADFNADGIPDVAGVNSYNGVGGNSMSVLFNQTPATTSQSATSTLSLRTSSASAGGLYIQASTSQAASLFAVQDSTGAGLFVVDAYGSVRAKGAIQGGVGSPDYAENITVSDPSVGAADVVTMDSERREHAVKSSVPYDGRSLGVISTSPGFVTNATAPDADDSTQRPLALSGRVPVKVTNENGPIQPGDYLTTSSTPGHAMKATASGQTIGRAMDSFDGEAGRVLMFIDNSYYNPYDGQNLQGSDGVFTSMVISGVLKTKDLIVTGEAIFEGNITVKSHIVSGGGVPELITPDNACYITGIEGTDSAGTIRIITAKDCTPDGNLMTLTFSKVFGKAPRVVLSPSNQNAAKTEYYKGSTTAENFEFLVASPLQAEMTYVYDYVIIE